jgi:hypothetical protein
VAVLLRRSFSRAVIGFLVAWARPGTVMTAFWGQLRQMAAHRLDNLQHGGAGARWSISVIGNRVHQISTAAH